MTVHEQIDHAEVERRRIGLTEQIQKLEERIRAAGGIGIDVLAVCKGHPVEAAIAAAQSGLQLLGENYAQDLHGKAETLRSLDLNAHWHFIGQLQTNKIRLVANDVAVWQSVDRTKVAKEIAKRAPGAEVFAQVNLSAEPQKAGCSFADLHGLIDEINSFGLTLTGLMGVGSAANDKETAHGFAELRRAVDRFGLAQCSMGMSADLELAIGEGSTMVRVGSDLFGARA